LGKLDGCVATLCAAQRDDNLDAVMCRNLLSQPIPRRIAVARHCFGCTAGQGLSCGGALAG